LLVPLGAGAAPIERYLVDEGQVGDAADGIPDPSAFMLRKGAGESGDEHDEVRRDGNEKVGAVHARHEGEIYDNEWIRQDPVDISNPEYLTKILLPRVGDMLV